MALIFFVLLIWVTVLVMREVTWPSQVLSAGIFAANLSTAWLIIALVTRLVGNGALRSLLRYGGWIWVTLILLDLTEEVRQLMDSLALDVGSVRFSLWTVDSRRL